MNDQITNSGDYDGIYTVVGGSIPDNVAAEYVYYINEDTEAPAFTQDATSTGSGWIRKWKTSWSQSVHGCPVKYKILITRDDGSGTMVDYDTSTAIHGTNYYEQVIYYTDT